MITQIVCIMAMSLSGRAGLGAEALVVGESRALTPYARLNRVTISAKSADEKICFAEATPSGAIRITARTVGKTKVLVRGGYVPRARGLDNKINDTIEVAVKPRPLPEYYYDALGYLQTLGPNLDLERRDWKAKIVGLPKYYSDNTRVDRMAASDVDKAFLVGTPAGDKDGVVQSKNWLNTVREAGKDYESGKLGEVDFSNRVIGAYVTAIGWEWVILQRLPDLYAGYFNAESYHRMQPHWDRKNKALYENRNLPASQLETIRKSEEAILESATRIEFDHFVNLMRAAGDWITPKHQAIGQRLMSLRRDLTSRSHAANDLYFQHANYAKERFFIVWYGASFYGPQTYPNQRKRLGYRVSVPAFNGTKTADQFPYPQVQVSPAESQFLGYFLTLAIPEPGNTEGREAPRLTLRLGPLDFTKTMKSSNDSLKVKERELLERKLALEREITALVDQPTELNAKLDELVNRQAELNKKMVGLEKDLAVIQDLELRSAEVAALYAEQARQCQMRNEVLVAAANGQPVKSGEYESLTKTIKIISEVIDGKLRGTPAEGLRKKWLKALDKAREESLQVDQLILQLQNRSAETLTSVENKRIQLRDIDRQLLDVIGQIDTPYPGLTGVSVEGEGREIFRARSTKATENLDEINEDITRIERLVESMKAEQLERKQDFQAAAARSVESGNRLSSKIWSVALSKAAIDAWFHLIDFSESFVSGGYVGLAMSIAQKAAESELLETAVPKSNDKPLPGSPEDIINKSYEEADLKQALTFKNAKTVGINRLFKETGTRFTKDTLNQFIGARIHAKIETPLTLWSSAIRGSALSAEGLEQEAKLISALGQETKNLVKGYSYFPSSSTLSPQDIQAARVKKIQKLGFAVARDILKTGMKGACDYELFLAWKDYAECVVQERLAYKPYILDLQHRQACYDALDDLLLRRAQLTSGLTTAQESLRTEWSDAVKSNSVLTISLSFLTHEDLTRPLRVFVGGVEAGRVGNTSTFRISAGKCQPGPDGLVPIQIR